MESNSSMVKRVWTEKEINDIVTMFEDGNSFETITNKYKTHFFTIKKILVDKGINTSRKRRWKQHQIDTIIKNYTENSWTLTDLTKHYKTNNREITKILRDNGIDPSYFRGRKSNRHVVNDYFRVIDTEQKAYILGLLMADGCVRKGKHDKYYLALELIDLDMIEKVMKELNADCKIYVSNRKREHLKNERTTYSFTIRSEELCNDLISYGVSPLKTKYVDWLPSNIPSDLKRHYLRGLIDGDGSIYHMKDGRWCITLTNNQHNLLVDYTSWIGELTGLPPNKVSKTSTSKRVAYTGKKAITIMKTLYDKNNISLDRKQKLVDQAIKDIV